MDGKKHNFWNIRMQKIKKKDFNVVSDQQSTKVFNKIL